MFCLQQGDQCTGSRSTVCVYTLSTHGQGRMLKRRRVGCWKGACPSLCSCFLMLPLAQPACCLQKKGKVRGGVVRGGVVRVDISVRMASESKDNSFSPKANPALNTYAASAVSYTHWQLLPATRRREKKLKHVAFVTRTQRRYYTTVMYWNLVYAIRHKKALKRARQCAMQQAGVGTLHAAYKEKEQNKQCHA